jgi:23S rRNA pseudouridine2605 synthase
VPAERLQKLISNAGVASRRAAEEMILAGRVQVNGKVVTTLGARADIEADVVLVDDVPIARQNYRYLMLNKPPGVLSTASDDRGRKVVIDLVADGQGLHPVGRLDLDSRGLILLTNDGQLTNLLTHPKHEVEKEYLVKVDRPLNQRERERCRRGIEDDGELLRAAEISTVLPAGDSSPEGTWLSIVLKQGHKREIRRMLQALGRHVLDLQRVRIGPLGLANLEEGAYRALNDKEVRALYTAATGATPR